MKQKVICGDCLEVMMGMEAESVDVVATSPPYNLNIKYNLHDDSLPRSEYLEWLDGVFQGISRVLKPDGSFFLNVGFTNVDPWVGMDIASAARARFELQNNICWVKSISIKDESHGHFKPIQSKRFINCNWEYIFHFTKTCKVELDRLAVGVPYQHKSNISRWGHTGGKDRRCRGNTWFIPYSTINSKLEKGNHPAIFPVGLPERCIKLHGVEEGMIVLDPFVGVGSTLLACKNLNIEGVGIDIDPDYCCKAKEMLSDE